MFVSIQKQDDLLLASLESSPSDGELLQFRNDLLARVSKVKVQGVIIDVTILNVLDSFATRILCDIAQRTKLREVPTIIVGINPEVACTMAKLGLSLDQIETAIDLEKGIKYLERLSSNGDNY